MIREPDRPTEQPGDPSSTAFTDTPPGPPVRQISAILPGDFPDRLKTVTWRHDPGPRGQVPPA